MDFYLKISDLGLNIKDQLARLESYPRGSDYHNIAELSQKMLKQESMSYFRVLSLLKDLNAPSDLIDEYVSVIIFGRLMFF